VNEIERIVPKILSSIEDSFSQQEIFSILENLANQFNFNYFTFARVFPKALTRLNLMTIGNYPKEWLDIYAKEKYIFIDPALKHGMSNRLPFFWKDIFQFEDEETKAFATNCSSFGLQEGFSLCIGGNCGDYSILSFGGTKEKQELNSTHPLVLITHIIIPYIHEKVAQILQVEPLYPIVQSIDSRPLEELTSREKECLLWSAEGKTALEISLILDIAEATVNFHLKNAVTKLDCANKTHAVAKSILLGLIKNRIDN